MRIVDRLSKKGVIWTGIVLIISAMFMPALIYWGMMASFTNRLYPLFQGIISYQSNIYYTLAVCTIVWNCWVLPAVLLRHGQHTGQPY